MRLFLRIIKKILKVIFALVFTALILGVCLSGKYHEADPSVQPLFGSPKITLTGGRFPIDATQITSVVSASDVAMLDCFSELEYADLSGSTCFKEISDWAAKHPEVTVIFSVYHPDGSEIGSDETKLDLSSCTSADLAAAVSTLSCLPKLKTVELGTVGANGFSLADLDALRAAAPQAEFNFAASVCGLTIDGKTESIDLSGVKHNEVQELASVLSCMGNIKTVELGQESSAADALTWEDIQALRLACPNARFNYSFSMYGKDFNLSDSAIDLRLVPVDDDGALVRKVLPCMNDCKTLDMDSTGVSDGTMQSIREDFPATKVIWRIWFGENYSVRTDTERILASKPTVGGMIYDADVLKYCTDVKYLDLGHNEEMPSIAFAANMPKLEVLIIAMTAVTDISPLSNCPELDYLELNTTKVSDLSPLAGCTKLRHINIACCENITDISPLYNITGLERLWIGSITPVPSEQVSRMKDAAPGCKIDTETEDPHGNAWRYTRYDPDEPKYYWVERYELLREQLGYNYQEYSFYWLDPLCELPAPAEYAGMYGKEVYG